MHSILQIIKMFSASSGTLSRPIGKRYRPLEYSSTRTPAVTHNASVYLNNKYQLTWITHFQQRKICQNTTNIFRLATSEINSTWPFIDYWFFFIRYKTSLVRPRMHYVLVLYPYLSSDTLVSVTHTNWQLSLDHIARIWKGKFWTLHCTIAKSYTVCHFEMIILHLYQFNNNITYSKVGNHHNTNNRNDGDESND